jgi:hypothetical protein
MVIGMVTNTSVRSALVADLRVPMEVGHRPPLRPQVQGRPHGTPHGRLRQPFRNGEARDGSHDGGGPDSGLTSARTGNVAHGMRDRTMTTDAERDVHVPKGGE